MATDFYARKQKNSILIVQKILLNIGKSITQKMKFIITGLIYEREFYKWIDGVGYDLVVGKRNGEKSKVLASKEICESECMISIEVGSAFLLRYFKVLRFFIHVFWLRPKLRQYLEQLLRNQVEN